MSQSARQKPSRRSRRRRRTGSILATVAVAATMALATPSHAASVGTAPPAVAPDGTKVGAGAAPVDVLVLAAYGSDQSPGAETAGQMAAMMNQVDAYYRQVSRTTVTVTSTVVPSWLPIPRAMADDCGVEDLTALIPEIRAAAIQAGYDPADYDRLIYFVHQSPTCGWGGGGADSGTVIGLNQLAAYTTIHELGHTFELTHTRSVECDTTFEGNCERNEYGGRFDPMGSTWPDALSFDAPHLERLGLLPSDEITNVTDNGTYTIGTLAGAAPHTPRVLKIQPSQFSVKPWYLELRAPVGADLPMASPAFGDWEPGVVVHRNVESIAFEQYDATPGSQTNDLADGALQVGVPLVTPDGVAFTVVSQSSTSATIRVSGYTAVSPPPATTSVTFTTPSTQNAGVKVTWQRRFVSPLLASLHVEASNGQTVAANPATGYATLPLPSSPGCLRYRLRGTHVNGSEGPSGPWSAPRCFFDELRPGSLVFRGAANPSSSFGIARSFVASTIDATWGMTNHYLPGAFDGYAFELTVTGFPILTGTTAGDVIQAGFTPNGLAVLPGSQVNASIVFTPRPGDDLSAEVPFSFNAALPMGRMVVDEGATTHLEQVPRHNSTPVFRELVPAEVAALRCASAGPADVAMTAPWLTSFPGNGLLRTAVVTPPNPGIFITVFGNLTSGGDRCLIDQSGPPTDLSFALVRIRDDEAPTGAGGDGSD